MLDIKTLTLLKGEEAFVKAESKKIASQIRKIGNSKRRQEAWTKNTTGTIYGLTKAQLSEIESNVY